jgi:ATP-dependent DNA ligase
MARRDGAGVRLLTRKGNDFSRRFPLVAAALAALPVRSCLIDGEAIVTDQKGLAVFDLIRGHQPNAAAVLCAFDLLELDGEDLRREPIETKEHPEVAAARQACGHRVQRALHREWRDRLPSGLRARL